MNLNIVKNINTFIFDVDGVFTTGSVIAYNSGEQARNFYVKDGMAVIQALKKNYNVCIISGGFQEGTKKRLEMLGIKDIYLKANEKNEVFEHYLKEKKLSTDQVVYVGDDLPDFYPIYLSGIGACPNDACRDIIEVADYISPFDGGKGCVRDIIETVMRAQNTWPTFDELKNLKVF